MIGKKSDRHDYQTRLTSGGYSRQYPDRATAASVDRCGSGKRTPVHQARLAGLTICAAAPQLLFIRTRLCHRNRNAAGGINHLRTGKLCQSASNAIRHRHDEPGVIPAGGTSSARKPVPDFRSLRYCRHPEYEPNARRRNRNNARFTPCSFILRTVSGSIGCQLRLPQ